MSPTTAAPPLLAKVRNDMKAAMKAKDKTRLDVLRGLISEVNNAAKSSNPVTTDLSMLNVICKRVKSSEGAIAEFETAKRGDLIEKEAAQIAVLEEYIKGSNLMSEEQITEAIEIVISDMRSEDKRIDKGTVMKALVGPGGALEGQLVDRKNIARLVNGIL